MTRRILVCAAASLLIISAHAMLAQTQSASNTGQAAAGAAAGAATTANGPSLKGRGTPGQLAIWLDGRTLGDSVVTEINGLIGIGTPAPDAKVTVVDEASFKAVLHVANVGVNGVAVQADGADAAVGSTDPGGEGIQATGGNSPASSPGVGVLSFGGNSQFVRGGNGIESTGGGGAIGGGTGVVGLGGGSSAQGGAGVEGKGGFSLTVGGPGVLATGGNSFGGPGFTSGDGIVARPGRTDLGAAPGRAGVFNGDVDVTGTLTKGGGSFRIDHPLDPANRYLSHSFVESPDMMNVYNGNITTDTQGLAIVELPHWFEALNKDFRYQLTVIGTFAQAMVAEKISGNRFAIRTSSPSVEVSWQVTGIRRDAWAEHHRIPVDEEKPAAERGLYLHPDLYGQPVDKSIESLHHPEPTPSQSKLNATGKTESPE